MHREKGDVYHDESYKSSEIFKKMAAAAAAAPPVTTKRGVAWEVPLGGDISQVPLDELGTTKGAAERLAAAQAGVVGLNKTTTKGWVAEYGADGTPLATAGFDAWENKWVQTGADAPPGTPPAEKPDAASVPALAEALAELGSVAVPTELVSQAFGYAEEDEGAPAAAPDESPMKVAESL